MKIEILNTFNHNGQAFQEGEIRIVPDELGDYFWRAGWVKDISGGRDKKLVESSETVLEVEDIISPSDLSETTI